MSNEVFEAWLKGQGLPTHILSIGFAKDHPGVFAAHLLKSPDSLRPSQRALLSRIVKATEEA